MMEIAKIIYLISILFNFIISLVILVKTKNIGIKWTYFLLIIVLNCWLIVNYLAYFTNNIKYTAIFGTGSFFVGTFIVPAFLFFTIYFPFKSQIKLWHKVLLIIPPTLIGWMSFGDWFLKDQVIIEGIGTPIYGDYHFVFSFYIILYLIITFWYLYRKYINCSPLEREKLKYIFLGFSLAAIIGVLADLILPYFIENSRSYWGSLGTIFISVSFTYSILRYRLLNIKLVIRKGIVNFISMAIILFVYIYLLIVFQKFFIEKFNWSEQTTTIVLVLLIVITIEPLRRALIKVVDKVFYSNQKDEKEEASKLKTIMSSSLQFDQLMKKIINEFKNYLVVSEIQFIWHNKKTGNLENYYQNERKVIVEANNSLFQYLQKNPKLIVTEEIPYLIEETENGESKLLEDIEQELKQLKVGLVLPIGEKDELVGILLFNKKENQEAFTADNIQYLLRLQSQMTGAIANALLYRQAMERIQKGISNS